MNSKKNKKSKATMLGFFNKARPYPHMTDNKNRIAMSATRNMKGRAASATAIGRKKSNQVN